MASAREKELTRDSFSAERMEMYWSAGVTHFAMLLPRYCTNKQMPFNIGQKALAEQPGTFAHMWIFRAEFCEGEAVF